MHVSEIDNVKIYNLSTGKSLPEVQFTILLTYLIYVFMSLLV